MLTKMHFSIFLRSILKWKWLSGSELNPDQVGNWLQKITKIHFHHYKKFLSIEMDQKSLWLTGIELGTSRCLDLVVNLRSAVLDRIYPER